MRYLFYCLLIIFGCSFASSYAGNVTIDDAKKVAVNWQMHQKMQAPNSLKKITTADTSVLYVDLNTYQGLETFYTFSFTGGGFVIVAADDNIFPILGYSDSGSVPQTIDNDGVRYWLDKYNRQIYQQSTVNSQQSTVNKAAWTNLKKNVFYDNKANMRVLPFLTTTWDQICYYNALCPTDAKGPCRHAYTGCVATALAQILKYNNYPPKGIGSYSYVDSAYGNISANFGNTTYNYSKMPNRLTSANNDVATLIYHCGVAVNMWYSANGSSSDDGSALRAFKKYFGYPSANLINKHLYKDSIWNQTLRDNLNKSLPIYYAGIDKSLNSGHAFVFDGYNGDFFHINWGWSGQYNGYFLLSALNPSGYDFTTYEEAIIDLIPVYSISGNLTYDNASKTQLANQKVVLTNVSPDWSPSAASQTTTTDANGYYIFNNVPGGIYQVSPVIDLLSGGFDPIDGMLCNKFSNNLYTFSDLLLKNAAEVNPENSVGSSDALLINRRYTGDINKFDKPDWTFRSDTLKVINTNITHNVMVVCLGDVNGSYDFSQKTLTGFNLSENGELNILINKTFDMPVYINDTSSIGALGLRLSFTDPMFEIVDVTPNVEGIVYHIDGNSVNIAWSAQSQIYKLQSSVPMFYLKVLCKGLVFGEELSFTVNDGSLVADFNGKIFSSENIVIPKLIFKNEFNNFSIWNFPNPSSGITNIQFVIPSDARVKVVVYDYTGRLIAELADADYKAGVYNVEFNGSGLASGIYYSRAIINNDKVITEKLIISN